VNDPKVVYSWDELDPPKLPEPSLKGRIAAPLRAVAAAVVTAVLLLFYLLFKAVERIFPRLRGRERVQRLWARVVARLAGLRVRVSGQPMQQGGALVSNHISWSDIFVLVGAARMNFVAKAEVRRWPGIGPVAALCDTVFVERRRTAARAQASELRGRMLRGERLMFFPEGTSTDGRRVLPFHSTLFAAVTAEGLRDVAWVQPVSVIYHAPPGLPAEFYGWWGDMSFGAHVWSVLQLSFGGEAEVVFHPPVRVADMPDRKALARWSWRAVEEGVRERL
jgi:1-acyl-sn-glycerol-3-phosphate acyltransferase